MELLRHIRLLKKRILESVAFPKTLKDNFGAFEHYHDVDFEIMLKTLINFDHCSAQNSSVFLRG